MEQVEEICERIVLVNKGKVILEGGVMELKNRFKENKFQLFYESTIHQELPDTLAIEVLVNSAQQLPLHITDGSTENNN